MMDEVGMGRESMLGAYSQHWIDDYLKQEFKGAKFVWDKTKAASFANTSLEDLLLDEYFLNGSKWIYPGIMDTLQEIFEERKKRKVTLVCILGGYGTGKTSGIGGILNWLNWFELTCHFDPQSLQAIPQEYYGMKPTSKIAFIALSKTVQKSEQITFSEMIPPFRSQFNLDYFPIDERIKSMIVVPNNNTIVFPNTATEAHNAGWSVYSYVMDEISFLEIVDQSSRSRGHTKDVYDQAAEAFESAEGRRWSRFKDDGMGILLSSVNYDEDFLVSTIRRAYRHIGENNIYYKVLLPWKIAPHKFATSKEYFYFDTAKFQIIGNKQEQQLLDKYYVERNIEDIIFGDNDNDPNDKLLNDFRSGKIKIGVN